MPELREALMAGDAKTAASLLKALENRRVLDDFIYVASHAVSREAIVLVDTTREALDYFSKEERVLLLTKCASFLAKVKKRMWDEPALRRYKGDPLKYYIDDLRARRDARYLAGEVLKKVGPATLADVWLRLALEDPGPNGATFVTGSACRRALLFADEALRERLAYWASEFLSASIPEKKIVPGGEVEYTRIEDDTELVKRVSLRPGRGCENLVFLHRIKQNLNTLNPRQIAHLIRCLEGSLEKEVLVALHGIGEETLEDLTAALKKRDVRQTAAAINTLCEDSLDEVCVALLSLALSVGRVEDVRPLIATHAACELARTASEKAVFPLVQAATYLFEVAGKEGT